MSNIHFTAIIENGKTDHLEPGPENDVLDMRAMTEPEKNHHYITHEPKFCRCRVCHEHFYGDTIAEARIACLEHGKQAHPDWGTSACYCPD